MPPQDGDPDDALNQRVGALETGQQSLSQKIDQILGIVGKREQAGQAAAQQARQAELDAPTSIAEEIRSQLEARDKEQAKENRLAAIEKSVQGVTEQKPEPPARPIEKFMGWR